MKVSRLYIKIFLAFVAVLMVSEFIVIWIVHSGFTGSPRTMRTVKRLKTIKTLAMDEMLPMPGTPAGTTPSGVPRKPEINTERLDHLLRLLATSYKTDIWLTGRDGKIVASSFEGPAPDTSELLDEDPVWAPENILVYKERKNGMKCVYSVLPPLPLDYHQLTYHSLSKRSHFEEEAWFLRGQVLLTLLAALFLIPVSRRIIRPIKKLTATAARYGEGDFTQRVKVRGKDEVAELASSFNEMADNLEKIIEGGKELTAHISHEIRSPLTRMRISLEMLKEKTQRDDLMGSGKYISDMEAEIDRMDFLVGKILQFSKMDMRTRPPMDDSVNFSSLILSVIDRYKTTAERKGLKLESAIEDITLGKCNVNAIRALLDNLMDNAFKYTEKGGTISLNLLSQNNRAVLEITNTHPPLAEEDLISIFRPFHRLGGEDTPGSGLGLATAKKIAEIHSGEMVAGNSEEGFRIRLTLPLE